MTLRSNEIITSLARAIDWSTNAIWAKGFESDTMQELAIKNINTALENIAEAEKLLKEIKQELQNR